MKTYKQYYEENKEKLQKRNRDYYATNKQKFLDRKKISTEKILLVKREMGGRCQLCGYDRSLYALQFHHVEEKGKKEYNVSYMSYMPLAKIRKEAKKCILICANCHFEIHHPK